MEVASLLLIRGGDATARNRDGLSPLDIAKEKYNKDICELLENAQPRKSRDCRSSSKWTVLRSPAESGFESGTFDFPRPFSVKIFCFVSAYTRFINQKTCQND